MKGLSFGYFMVGFAMLGSSLASIALKPTVDTTTANRIGDLDVVIPEKFETWQIDKAIVPIEPSPELQQKLKLIYSQTLSRTYVNVQTGQRIMLSIAYGSDQNKNSQMHRPDVCYKAQGFQVLTEQRGILETQFGRLPVKRLVAMQGLRHEPITYWMVVGENAVFSGSEQRLAQLRVGLTGKVADGLLVRVSSIDLDDSRAFEIQERFLKSMISSVNDKDRGHLIGKNKA